MDSVRGPVDRRAQISSLAQARHQRTDSSAFYTASWGSPYQHPPSTSDLSPASAVRHLRSASSDDIETDSPSRPPPSRSSKSFFTSRGHSKRISFPGHTADLDAVPQPLNPGGQAPFRKRASKGFTEEWIRQYLSGRSNSERGNWWSDDSAEEGRTVPSEGESSHKSLGDGQGSWLEGSPEQDGDSVQTPTLKTFLRQSARAKHRRKGAQLNDSLASSSGSEATFTEEPAPHRAHRASSGTPQVSKMLLSKYADAPTAQNEPAGPTQATPSPTSPTNRAASPKREKPLPPPPLSEKTQDAADAEPVQPSPAAHKPSLSRTGTSQSPRKRVFWKGKACIIALPANDTRGAEGGTPRPWTEAEADQRLKAWRDDGYDVRGFGHWGSREVVDGGEGEGQSRRIFPDPGHWKREHDQLGYRVSIPDRRGKLPCMP